MPTGFGWWFKTQYQKNQWQDMSYKGREYQQLIYEKLSPRIVRLTFNRPDKRNALNDQMYNEFLAGLNQANDDPKVKVVIIRGAGPHFGSGHELSSPVEEESPPVHPSLNPTIVDYFGFERRRCSKFEDILHYPKALIAQVHGKNIGASEIISGMCDVIVASEDAQFGLRGFGRRPAAISDWPGFWPYESQKYWGGQIDPWVRGKEAEEMGFITKIVKLEELEGEAIRLAEALAKLPTEVIAMYKEWLTGTMDIIGHGASYKNHYGEHMCLQYVHFRPYEVNMYKEKKDIGLSNFIKKRYEKATVEK